MKSVIEEDGTVGEPLMYSPKGDQLAYSLEHPGRANTCRCWPGRCPSGGLGAAPNRIGFSPDGQTLYSGGGEEAGDRLLVWDLVGDRRVCVRFPCNRSPNRHGPC